MKEEIIITNPLSLKSLYYLFFQPTKLFAPNVSIKYNFWIVFLFFLVSSFCTLASIYFEQDVSKMFLQFGNKKSFIYVLTFYIFIWYVWGYFFNLRLKWSGVTNFNKIESRILMIYTDFIWLFFGSIIDFVFYKNHAINDNYLCFSFSLSTHIYSCFITYLAIKNKFNIFGIKSFFWFVLFPTIFLIPNIIYRFR
jgi:hypothetical protein